MTKRHSTKHHYLPVHYLEGFTNGQNSFFVYDKQTGKIFPTSPRDAFFENDLNTVILPTGDTSDFVEELYTDMENRLWGSLDRIRESTHKTAIELKDKMGLFTFLHFLYWRLPCNIESVEKLADKAFIDNEEFNYLKLKRRGGGEVPREVIEKLKNSSAFRKSFKLVIPVMPFFKDRDWATKVDNWQFIYTGDDKRWNIVGDNPIISKTANDQNIINCLDEFIFPVSGNITLISLKKTLHKGLPPEFTIQYGAAIIERSQRFIASQDKDFLEALIKYYEMHIRFGKTDTIIAKMFGILEQ